MYDSEPINPCTIQWQSEGNLKDSGLEFYGIPWVSRYPCGRPDRYLNALPLLKLGRVALVAEVVDGGVECVLYARS